MFKPLKSGIIALLIGLSSIGLAPVSVRAAEEISLSYGFLIESLKVSSLEAFAKDGTVSEDLEPYLRSSSAEERAEFRAALTKRIDVDPVLISRFFNSAMGEAILARIGKGITIKGQGNGKYALRGAIVTAAFDPEGLTLLNVLKKLPVDIQIQGEYVLGADKELDKVIADTETLVKEMRLLTAQEASTDPQVNYGSLKDIRKPGNYQVKKEVWTLTDASRNRQFYVDVYIPQGKSNAKTPVIVFSHGLASRPEDFDEGLQQLASYGYLVAAPQHPGSDALYLQGMLEGFYKNIFDVNEFINRPLDISYVIDELERRNPTQFQGKLDLNNVGVAGHSFGGYTVLAIAGATIDFDNLQKDCDRPYQAIDTALLLQCRALELPRKDYNFRDPRVKAVFAANAVNRSIFGQKGIEKISIPVFLASGSYDPATPPVFEQVETFTWLKTPDKYWGLFEGQAHVNFTKLDPGIKKSLDSVGNLTLPSQNLITNYSKAMTVSFFQTYIGKDNSYRPYLQSAYAKYLSQGETFDLDLISGASSAELDAVLKKIEL